MAGRTVGSKYTRAYVDGYDLSGYARSVGELAWGFSHNDIITLTDSIKGAYPGQCTISIGDINGVLVTNTGSTAMHGVFKSASDAVRDVMIPVGIKAAPANGDPVFCAQVAQNTYQAVIADEVVTVNMDLGSWDERGDSKAYPIPWGWLVQSKATKTAVNTGTFGVDFGDTGTTLGGFMMYQMFTADAAITLKIQDSTDNSSWNDLVSSGSVDASSAPKSAIVPLATHTTTVDRYLRWQLVMGGASTVTFALAFIRGY